MTLTYDSLYDQDINCNVALFSMNIKNKEKNFNVE